MCPAHEPNVRLVERVHVIRLHLKGKQRGRINGTENPPLERADPVRWATSEIEGERITAGSCKAYVEFRVVTKSEEEKDNKPSSIGD